MRMTMPSWLTTAIAVAGISATLAATPARADEWKKTYQVSGRASVYVKTGDGDVTAEAHQHPAAQLGRQPARAAPSPDLQDKYSSPPA